MDIYVNADAQLIYLNSSIGLYFNFTYIFISFSMSCIRFLRFAHSSFNDVNSAVKENIYIYIYMSGTCRNKLEAEHENTEHFVHSTGTLTSVAGCLFLHLMLCTAG